MPDIYIGSEIDRQKLYKLVDQSKVGDKFSYKSPKTYTQKQRGSLHVWCGWCADLLNENDLYFERKCTFGDGTISIPWSMDLFKDHVYKMVLESVEGVTSTEDQESITPQKIALIISKRYAENGLLCPPWPSLR